MKKQAHNFHYNCKIHHLLKKRVTSNYFHNCGTSLPSQLCQQCYDLHFHMLNFTLSPLE